MNVANNWAFWIGLIGALAVLYVLPTLIGVLRHVESLALVVILNFVPDRVACGAGCRVHDAPQGRLLSTAGHPLYRQRANRRQDIPGGGSVFTVVTFLLAPIPLYRRCAAAGSTSPTAY